MSGRRWRKIANYIRDYDDAVRANPGRDPKAVRRRASRRFRRCRRAIETLRDFLFGDLPDNRNAVPAAFFPDNDRIEPTPIAASIWRTRRAATFFWTARLYYDLESGDIVPDSQRNNARAEARGRILVKGHISVSRRALMRRLNLEFPETTAGQPAARIRAGSARQQAMARQAAACIGWLAQALLQTDPLSMKKADWRAEAERRFGVESLGLPWRSIWSAAIALSGATGWSRQGRKPKP
jgi:hypothetical protein